MNKKSHLSAFLCLLLLSMLLLTFCSAVPAHAALSWSVQTVDENGAAIGNGYSPIAVDSNNTAHIAYTAFINYTSLVMYASWNGTGWNSQKVYEGHAYSLVLDADGNPHILHSGNGLTYSSWTGTDWVSQTVDAKDGGFGMVALDSSGNPRVAYTDGTSIKYAILKGSSWSIQTVAKYNPRDLALRLSFALGKDNTPYIMYSPASYADNSQAVGIRAANVTLATYQNSGWKIQRLSLPPPTGNYGNLVVDSKGYLHSIFTKHHFVSSQDKTILSTVLYANWNGNAWDTQTVVSDIKLNSMSLALDSRDYPHIFTSSGTYASWTGTKWNIQTANLNRGDYGPCYLAVDSNGNPHICYRQATSYKFIANIVYATATEIAQPSSPTSPALPFLLVSTVIIVIIGAIIITVYFKKRKESRDS